jgi:ketosteroid isomerase-like protein
MDVKKMRDLVESHLRAEGRGDVDGAVAVYTDDIEHDVVGFPHSPSRGVDGGGTSTST